MNIEINNHKVASDATEVGALAEFEHDKKACSMASLQEALRRKEKEVLSLQLHIHRLEQRLSSTDQTVQEQRLTIRSLRRTIQQDLQLIKTMAIQKQRQMQLQAAESSIHLHQQRMLQQQKKHHQQDTLDHIPVAVELEDPVTALTLENSQRNQSKPPSIPVEAQLPPTASPTPTGNGEKIDDNFMASPHLISPPNRKTSADTNKTPTDKGIHERIKHQKSQLKAKLEQFTLVKKSHDENEDDTNNIDSLNSSPVVTNEIDGGECGSIPCRDPFAVAQEGRSAYWSESGNDLASDPSRIFASFRGGLLDIPKSPPPAEHLFKSVKDNRNRKKLRMDAKQKAALSMLAPLRGVVSRSSSGMSEISCYSITETTLNLMASQTNALPSMIRKEDTISKKSEQAVDVQRKQMGELPSLLISSDSSSTHEDAKVAEEKAQTGLLTPVASPQRKGSSLGPVVEQQESVLDNAKISKPQMIVTAPASTNNEEADKSDNSGCTAPPNASLPAIAKSDSPQVKNSESVSPRPGEAISSSSSKFPVTNAICRDKYGDTGTYSGTISVAQGLPNGVGTMEYDSGRVYSGDWVAGQWHGRGKLHNPNGDFYEGEFVFDARHGQGVYKWENGDVYKGIFFQDKRHGKGVFSFHNGNVYAGEFVDGLFEGYGRYDFGDGYYEGEWKQGRYDGNGVLKYATGGKYTGEFRNSVAHGFGMEVTPDGVKRRGVWSHGQPEQYYERGA